MNHNHILSNVVALECEMVRVERSTIHLESNSQVRVREVEDRKCPPLGVVDPIVSLPTPKFFGPQQRPHALFGMRLHAAEHE